MKIESGLAKKRLKEMETGDLFFLDGVFYILTDLKCANVDMFCCVSIETGSVYHLAKIQVVNVIDDAVLKIGGYYK